MIRIDPALCSGCSRCEVNCSFFHSGRVGRSRARVRVVKVEEIGLDYPVICRQCAERYCTRCPESAIEVGPLGQIIVSPTLCTLCGACEKLCPIGAIEIAHEVPHVCDLCGGEPRCVEQCTMGALRYDPGTGDSMSLAEFKKAAKGRDTEARRVAFAREMTASLRDAWLRERR